MAAVRALALRLLGFLLLALAVAGCAAEAAPAASSGRGDDMPDSSSEPSAEHSAGNDSAVDGPAIDEPADADYAAGTDTAGSSGPTEAGGTESNGAATDPTSAATGSTSVPAGIGSPLPPAPIGFEALAERQRALEERREPVWIDITGIGVVEAPVIPVGVNAADASFEVPPADQVGWYEFGSAPGEAGSAVLAAHIAFDGVDGVFRYLADVEDGAVVEIGFDDGTSVSYRIISVREYDKQELPDSLFARDGREQIALITCGGDFNRQLSSYESNVVAIAVPVDSDPSTRSSDGA